MDLLSVIRRWHFRQGIPIREIKTPDDLRTMLIDRLPENLRDVIDVYVVDVSRPAGKAAPGT